MHNVACNEVDEFNLLLYDIEGAKNKNEWKLYNTYIFNCVNRTYKDNDVHWLPSF